VFVPTAHALSFRDPPVEPGPLYAIPTIALFATILAAVPLGIARHAIDIVRDLAGTKIAARSRRSLNEDATMQANLGIASRKQPAPPVQHHGWRPSALVRTRWRPCCQG
jgi:alkylation response protein AidB-like acyl-CoA dehydrogenase